MLKLRFLVGLIAVVAAALTGVARGAERMALSYQGQLSDSTGTPLTGTHSLRFRILDAPRTGKPLLANGVVWEETQDVPFDEGKFSVYLGVKTEFPLDFFDGPPQDAQGPLRFLEVTVDGKTVPATPRLAVPKK